jgi:hypothetical protein
MKSNLSIFIYFLLLALLEHIWESIDCQIWGLEDLPVFSSKSFIVLALTFLYISVIQLSEFIFGYGVK